MTPLDQGANPPTPPPSERSGNGPPGWDRITDLFHEALELEPAARDSFLSNIAEGDPALADDVRSLLSAHEKPGGPLDAPPASPLIRAAPSGDRLGPYRIVEE